MLFAFLAVFTVWHVVKDYYSYVDMRDNPEDKRSKLFFLKGSVFCAAAVFMFFDLRPDLSAIALEAFFLFKAS